LRGRGEVETRGDTSWLRTLAAKKEIDRGKTFLGIEKKEREGSKDFLMRGEKGKGGSSQALPKITG